MSWLNAPKIEQWVFEETLRMNERGFPMDIPLVKKTIRFLERYTADRVKECEKITGGILPSQVGNLLEWLQGKGVDIDNLQRNTLERALVEQELSRRVRKVIEIRLEMGRVSTKKLYKMLEVDSGDGRARGSFIYHGAGTGRFTARGLQPHNFQRPTIKEVDDVIALLESEQFDEIVRRFGNRTLEAVGSCMRGFFRAPKGKTFVRADYNAIEARVLAWLAGETEAVELFHQGEDIYCDMAGFIFGEDPKVIKAGHNRNELKYSNMRKLGKDTILGCGYNMGVATFLWQAENKGEETINEIPIRTNVALRGQRDKESFNSEAWRMASKAVYGYRDKYVRIVKLWHDMELAAKLTLKTGVCYSVSERRIKFRKDGDSLVMCLPSGRTIYYPQCSLVERLNKWTGKKEQAIRFRTVLDSGKFVWEYLYGGKLVENAVQAIARDLLVYGMRNAVRHAYELIGTVHDEIISLLGLDRVTSDTQRHFENIICQLPWWAKGDTLGKTIPLMAEGAIGDRYGK